MNEYRITIREKCMIVIAETEKEALNELIKLLDREKLKMKMDGDIIFEEATKFWN